MMCPSLVRALSLLAFGSLTIFQLASANQSSGRAVDFQEGLLFRGVKENRRNIFFGAAALGHDASDSPPNLFNTDDTCGNKCQLFAPKVVNRSGDSVMIRWNMNGSSSWQASDFIGLYEVGAPNHNYIDWVHASNDITGFGQRTFKLYNLRSKMQFRYLVKDPTWYSCSCASEEFDFALGASEPTQGHLSLTGDPTQMQFTWVSGDTSGGFVEVKDYKSFSASVDRYDASDMCGPPANTTGPWAYRDVGYIHTATIEGLKGDTTYEYRYGQNGLSTDWFKFTTEPDGSKEWKAIAYGDMGMAGHDDTFYDQMWGAKLTQADILSRDPRLVVHFGDLSYARGVGFVWDVWGNQISEIARKVPYMVSLGNHEYDHDSGGDKDPSGAAGTGFHPTWGNYGDDSAGECGVPVVKRFPNPPPSGHGIFWYSYNFANVHWVMLSSEHNYTTEAAQYKWLDNDLAKVDRSKTPWVIVTAHRPAYNSEMYAGDYNVSLNMARNLDNLLVKHKVNLFLAGHYHAYQRTCAVAHMECQGQVSNPAAPVHITVGSAGASLDGVKDYPADSSWTMRTMDTYGTLLLRIQPEKIIGEFWGAEDTQAPALPFGLLDTFDVFPFNGARESPEYV